MAIGTAEPITLDINGRREWEQKKTKQYNKNSRSFEITFTDQGTIFEIPSGTIARVKALTYDKREIYNDLPTPINNKVLLELTEPMQMVSGEMLVEVILFNGGRLGSGTFPVMVEASVHNSESITASPTYSTFENALDRVDGWNAQFETKYNNLETEYATQLASKVTQVNGILPDVNGSVTIDIPQTDISNLATKTEVQAVASGSPKATFATLSLLQADATANTTDGKKSIYLVAADGKWYYWNGTAWAIGGVYQSTAIADKSITYEKTTFIVRSENLYDVKQILIDKYLNGTIVASSVGYGVTDYIYVKDISNVIATYVNWYAFYDINKVAISSGSAAGANTSPISIPVNAYYIRLSTDLIRLTDKYVVSEGVALLPYQQYCALSTDIIPVDYITQLQYKPLQKIISKIILSSKNIKINLIGDSITAGVGGEGYNDNDKTVGHCWANSIKEYFESKFNCSVVNSGISGVTSGYIKANITTTAQGQDIIICMIGTNDRAANNPSSLYSNLKYIHDYVTGLGKEIIFMSSLPATVANEETKTMHMEDVDNVIMKIAADTNREYISLFKLITDYCNSNGLAIDSLLSDAVHPNDVGYDVMFYLICKELGIATKRPDATW